MEKGLRTKCIYEPVVPEDGLRISVMSRHTLPDGRTPDPKITMDSFDEWWKELAPQDNLVGSYYKRGLDFKDYTEEYLKFLREEGKKDPLNRLITLAMSKTITLLCVETTPEFCHRRLLAEECKVLSPNLPILLN